MVSCRTYQGLAYHTDNNLIGLGPEAYHLNGSILISNVGGFSRLGVLCAYVPKVDFTARQCLLSIACRYSQLEHGNLGKGPKERPCPRTFVGGEPLPLKDAKAMNNDDLIGWIRDNIKAHWLQKLAIKAKLSPRDLAAANSARQSRVEALAGLIGHPILTLGLLAQSLAKEPVSLLGVNCVFVFSIIYSFSISNSIECSSEIWHRQRP